MGFVMRHKWKIVVVVGLLIFAYAFFINAGKWLVAEDEPEDADVVVVLMGSGPDRVLQAVDLYREGYADTLLAVHNGVNGYQLVREKGIDYPTDADLAKMVAGVLGVSEADFIILDGPADSTRDEAVYVREFLKKREDINSILLVTSKYHSFRSSLVFNKAVGSLDRDIKIISSPSKYDSFNEQEWWQEREDMKRVFLEYCKLVNYYCWEQFRM